MHAWSRELDRNPSALVSTSLTRRLLGKVSCKGRSLFSGPEFLFFLKAASGTLCPRAGACGTPLGLDNTGKEPPFALFLFVRFVRHHLGRDGRQRREVVFAEH